MDIDDIELGMGNSDMRVVHCPNADITEIGLIISHKKVLVFCEECKRRFLEELDNDYESVEYE